MASGIASFTQGAVAVGGEATLAGIAAATTALAIKGALDSYNGAVISTELKAQAIQQGLYSQVTKQADAQAGRAAKSAETWGQM